MQRNLAPVLVFTYRRLDALKETIKALQQNTLAGESELFIFSDGPKGDSDDVDVQLVREYLNDIDGFRKITIKKSPNNKGLATSIISGVSEVFETFDKVIVLEDDLLTTPNFLTFMNKALHRYENECSVFSISGYSFDLGKNDNETADVYLFCRGWSWGWATMKSKWEKVDWEVKDYHLFIKDKAMKREFARGGSDLNRMLRLQMAGCLDSWAIRWFYHQFKEQGLTVYPVESKVHNNGFDDTATHTNGSDRRYRPRLDTTHSEDFVFTSSTEVNPYYRDRFLLKLSLGARLVSRLENVILKLRRICG